MQAVLPGQAPAENVFALVKLHPFHTAFDLLRICGIHQHADLEDGLKLFQNFVLQEAVAMLVDNAKVEERHERQATHFPLRISEEFGKLRAVGAQIEHNLQHLQKCQSYAANEGITENSSQK